VRFDRLLRNGAWRALKILAAWLLCLPLLAHSADVPPFDVTGLWFDEHHPGWGLGLVQQNDTVFATLFTYDANGAPSWLVATLQVGQDSTFGPSPCANVSLLGPLYQTRWPLFGSTSNPQGSMQVQTVGTLSVGISTTSSGIGGCDRNILEIGYTINGVLNGAKVTHQTWSSNQARLYGQYAAGLALHFTGAPCPPNAPSIEGFTPGSQQLSMSIAADDANPPGVRLTWGTGIDTVCQIDGTYSQNGQLGSIAGTLSCGAVGNGIPMGAAQVSNLYAGTAGFDGSVAFTTSCPIVGTIAGARRP
jgi:hypothetical protein